MSTTEQLIFRSLLNDIVNPLKIIWAYEGFKNENSLRQSFLKIVQRKSAKRFQPCNFPDLILCKGNSIIKANGMPLAFPMDQYGFWPIMISADSNPLLILIYQIYFRVMRRFGLKPVGLLPELHMQMAQELLLGRVFHDTENKIFIWDTLSPAHQAILIESDSGRPVELDPLVAKIFVRLMKEDKIFFTLDDRFKTQLENNDALIGTVLQRLYNTGMINLNLEEGTISLKKKETAIIVFKNDKFFVGDMADKKFSDWSKKNTIPTFITIDEILNSNS